MTNFIPFPLRFHSVSILFLFPFCFNSVFPQFPFRFHSIPLCFHSILIHILFPLRFHSVFPQFQSLFYSIPIHISFPFRFPSVSISFPFNSITFPLCLHSILIPIPFPFNSIMFPFRFHSVSILLPYSFDHIFIPIPFPFHTTSILFSSHSYQFQIRFHSIISSRFHLSRRSNISCRVSRPLPRISIFNSTSDSVSLDPPVPAWLSILRRLNKVENVQQPFPIDLSTAQTHFLS